MRYNNSFRNTDDILYIFNLANDYTPKDYREIIKKHGISHLNDLSDIICLLMDSYPNEADLFKENLYFRLKHCNNNFYAVLYACSIELLDMINQV